MQDSTQAFAEGSPSIPLRGRSTEGRRFRLRSRTVRFLLHYAEMVGVMVAGMMTLGSALVLIAAAAGYGLAALEADAPALVLAGMGLSMTAPMVWWMRFRGHSFTANRAMAISMIAPTSAAIALLAAGSVTDLSALLEIQHMSMLPGMAVAMLIHRGEYVHGSRSV